MHLLSVIDSDLLPSNDATVGANDMQLRVITDLLYSTEARVYSDRWLPRVPPRDPTSKLFRPRTMFFRCVDPCKSFFPV